MPLNLRNDPFSNPETSDPDEEGGSLITFARILAFLFAAVLSWILYRVVEGAYRQYKHSGGRSLLDRRRGAYRRVPSLRLHRPVEDLDDHEDDEGGEEGYRDREEDGDVDALLSARSEVGGRDAAGKGKRVAFAEVVDEGFHDGESERSSLSGSASGSVDVWKALPERPLPDKPLPDVPR